MEVGRQGVAAEEDVGVPVRPVEQRSSEVWLFRDLCVGAAPPLLTALLLAEDITPPCLRAWDTGFWPEVAADGARN